MEIVLAQLLCRLYTFGAALFSLLRILFLYGCDLYLRFRTRPVVLDIELSMSTWYQMTRPVMLHERRILLLLLLAADRAVCGVRCAACLSKSHAKQNNDFVPIRTRKSSAASKKHPNKKTIWKLPCLDLRAGSTRKFMCLTYPVNSQQRIGAPPRRDQGCQNTFLDVPLASACRSALSREQWRLSLSKLEKILR